MIAFDSTARPPASTISRSETAQVEQQAPLAAPRGLIRPEAAPSIEAAQGGSERPGVTRGSYTSDRAVVDFALEVAIWAGIFLAFFWLPELAALGARIGEAVAS